MKSVLLVLFATLGAALNAEPQGRELTSSEAQGVLDAALSVADKVVVAYRRVYWDGKTRGGTIEEQTLVDEISDPVAIQAISDQIRVRMPEPVLETIDGEERWVTVYTKIDADDRFVMEIRKGEELLLSLSIFGDECIYCARLLDGSVIRVDQARLRPIVEVWRTRLKKKGEPGATDNPGDAQ